MIFYMYSDTNKMNPAGYGVCVTITIFIILTSNGEVVTGASLGDTCSSDADCTSTLVNSRCSRMFDCANGTCACKSGYGNSNGNGCENILRDYNEPCGSGYHCHGDNQECDTTTSRCACTYWYEYSTLAGECTLRTYKILTETCGGQYNLECLQSLLDAGGGCSGTCTCLSGYLADTSESYTTCRAPRWGESCEWSPKCVVSFNTSTISDDDSSTAPTCSNSICTCPPSHEHRYVNGYDMCLNKVAGDFVRYDNGQNCIDFNECKSFLCVKCPGAASGVCMAAPELNTTDSQAVSTLRQSSFPWVAGVLLTSVVVTL